MDFHELRADGRVHVMTTHRCDADETALQLVSAKKIAYWQTLEEDYAALLEKLASAEAKNSR